MAFLTTRGLGRGSLGGGTTFVTTSGLGRGIAADAVDRLPVGDSQKFYDMRDYAAQALREDEELLLICRGLIKIICR